MTTNQDEIARRIVDREVRVCLSSLVSTLAKGAHFNMVATDLQELAEQAAGLSCPIPDYEEAALDAGWRHMAGDMYGSDEERASARSWQDLCEANDIEPYDREVFEHWAISDWLADKLEAKGEKVDRDFASMIVWARTTTGQAIYCDSVLQDIAQDLSRIASDAA